MKRLMVQFIMLVIVFSIVVPVPSYAIWPDNGLRITDATAEQYDFVMCSDGSGGAIFAWDDNRNGNNDIFVSRVDAAGQSLWALNGLAICTNSVSQTDPVIVPDGSGGAIVAWVDWRSVTETNIYIQHISSNGTLLWPYDGLPVCTAAGDQVSIAMTPLDDGGAVLAWADERSGSTTDIYAQRISSNGFLYWMPDGVPVMTVSEYWVVLTPEVIPDGEGGAIISWTDYRGSDADIYAQRIGRWGVPQWTTDGVVIVSESYEQTYPKMVEDGAGGAVICWMEHGNPGVTPVYAQRIDSDGARQWPSRGALISGEGNEDAYPDIASDGAGGAFIAWKSQKEDIEGDIFAQHINGAGVTSWQENGLPACIYAGYQIQPLIVSDGVGGVIISWRDYRFYQEIYAQRMDGSGNPLWNENGIGICTGLSGNVPRGLVSDGNGGAIVGWANDRYSTQFDIYAQQVDPQGRTGYFSPAIHSAADVPGDQGGYVSLSWDASIYDYMSGEIDNYTIWRATDAAAAAAMLEEGAILLESPSELSSPEDGGKTDLHRAPYDAMVLLRASGDYYWEYLMYQEGAQLAHYSRTIPTTFDSSGATGTMQHYFQVIAHANTGTDDYVSEPDSGYSVDNLAPAVPLGIVGCGSGAPEGLDLNWDDNTETDLAVYRVYRGIHEGFTPDEVSLLGEPVDAGFFDSEWADNLGYWYKVSAVDIHGNESPFASYYSGMEVTGSDIPLASYLEQNFPNPFNPVTMISFGIRLETHVALRIYDPSGRIVRVLLEGVLPAGSYVEEWDGLSASGRKVASGVYFYKLSAGDFVETKKMVLLR